MILCTSGIQAVSRGLQQSTEKLANQNNRLKGFLLGARKQKLARWRAMGADAMYCCKSCGGSLNVSSNDLYPPDTYFEAGNRGTLSFMEVDLSKFRKQKEKRWRSCFPFFDSWDSWGIQRKRTQLRCVQCNKLLGFIYNDMPRRGGGYSGWGPSQNVPRGERYRLKIKALQETTAFHQKWQ